MDNKVYTREELRRLKRIDAFVTFLLIFFSIFLVVLCVCGIFHSNAEEQPPLEIQEEVIDIREIAQSETSTANVVDIMEGAKEKIFSNLPAPAIYDQPATVWTNWDFDYVCRVVTREANKDLELCYWTAQCIKNACETDYRGLDPEQVTIKYRYAKPASYYTEEAYEACYNVLYLWNTYEPAGGALYFYNPKYCEAPWHESQEYVATVHGIRFFK